MSDQTNDQASESASQFALLKSRSFLPLFVTQAIGAFNDNGLRNGIAILITFDIAVRQGWDATLFVQAGLALFMLPYFLFSAIAGQIAEKLEKQRLIVITTAMEIAIMSLAAIGFLTGNMPVLLVALFCTGMQSTLFGPVKYSVLPAILKPEELTGGNGLVEMETSAGGASGSAPAAAPVAAESGSDSDSGNGKVDIGEGFTIPASYWHHV